MWRHHLCLYWLGAYEEINNMKPRTLYYVANMEGAIWTCSCQNSSAYTAKTRLRGYKTMSWKERLAQSKSDWKEWLDGSRSQNKQTSIFYVVLRILSAKTQDAFPPLIRCRWPIFSITNSSCGCALKKAQQVSSQMVAGKPCHIMGASSERIEFTQKLHLAPRSIFIGVQNRSTENVKYGCGQ